MSDHTTPRGSRSARAGRELALTVGAVAGLICVVAATASMLFGIKPLVFRSGSMSPEITTGSLALARTVPATDLAVGDVVSVVNGQGTRITHRVYELDQQAGNSVTVTLKGDANANPDVEPYFITEADRIFFSVGGLGYAVAWLSSPLAIFLGGALVGGLVIIAFRPNSRRRDSDDGPSGGIGSVEREAAETMEFPMVSSGSGTDGRRSAFSFRKFAVLGVSVLALIGATQVNGTSAAFTDTSVAKSGSLAVSSNVLPAIGSIHCTTNGGTAIGNSDVTWPHIGYPFRYMPRYYNGNTSLNKVWPRDPGENATPGTNVAINMVWNDGGSATGYTYTLRVYTVNRLTGQESTDWRGYRLKRTLANLSLVCVGEDSSISPSSFAVDDPESAPLARGVVPTTTPVDSTVSTAPTTTMTPSVSPSTVDPTVTTSATKTAEPSTSTKVESPTSTTTTDTTTMTTTETSDASVPIAAPEASASGVFTAALMQTRTGAAVVITDRVGTQVSSSPVSATATAMWQSDADELWIMDGANVYRVNAETGVSEKNPSGEAPAEIAAWIDGQK
ncbi:MULTISPECIES: signal peptidase I [Rhodococcus]|uniref:signal peptidase I n=1 Tax=Rhodococcus TaxID=1827 RepID=UPI0002B7D0D0|nr:MULTISPECIES: signal peptidase I [Rhodococcus]MYV25726.1 signal peptidase I [Rhodococcus erythropolis]EME20047.1 S26 family peptidase [Rhodococcus qingshengii BKS 20-40]MDI9955319.1 signal peptidase I [Rhodococcus sp. IEGM 1237]MDI9961340.1 signal peptidase I [Rhodococcus sp. IEGM 1251]MDV8123384.1 signal peptidase I [Rhodococcus sp. IEGM 1304]